MLPKETKQDPRVVRTRRDLIVAMCQLLKEKRFTKITVRDITDRALINRATFYAHFEDKYDLLERMLYLQIGAKLRENGVHDGRITRKNLQQLTLTLCEFLVEFHAEHTPTDQTQNQNMPIEWQIMEFLYDFLLMGIRKNGTGGTELEPETIATLVSSTILGAALRWTRGKREVEAQVISDQIVDFIMFGLESKRTIQ